MVGLFPFRGFLRWMRTSPTSLILLRTIWLLEEGKKRASVGASEVAERAFISFQFISLEVALAVCYCDMGRAMNSGGWRGMADDTLKNLVAEIKFGRVVRCTPPIID